MARVGAIHYAEPRGSLVFIITNPCPFCGKQHEFLVSRGGYEAWQYGAHIQNALSDLSANDHETLLSGSCGECFDKAFAYSDEEE